MKVSTTILTRPTIRRRRRLLPSHLWHFFQSDMSQCQYTYPYYKRSSTITEEESSTSTTKQINTSQYTKFDTK